MRVLPERRNGKIRKIAARYLDPAPKGVHAGQLLNIGFIEEAVLVGAGIEVQPVWLALDPREACALKGLFSGVFVRHVIQLWAVHNVPHGQRRFRQHGCFSLFQRFAVQGAEFL